MTVALALVFAFLPMKGSAIKGGQEDLRPDRILHEPTGIIVQFPDTTKRKTTKQQGFTTDTYESKGPGGSTFLATITFDGKRRGTGDSDAAHLERVTQQFKVLGAYRDQAYGRCPAKWWKGKHPETGEVVEGYGVQIFDTVVQFGVIQSADKPFPEKEADAFFDSFVLYVDMVHPTGPREKVRSDMTTLAGMFTTPILEHALHAPLKAGDDKLLLYQLQEGKVFYQVLQLEPPPENRKKRLSMKSLEGLRNEVSREMGAKRTKERKLRIGPSEALEWELNKDGAKSKFRVFVLGQAIYLMQYTEHGGYDADKATKFLDSFHPVFGLAR